MGTSFLVSNLVFQKFLTYRFFLRFEESQKPLDAIGNFHRVIPQTISECFDTYRIRRDKSTVLEVILLPMLEKISNDVEWAFEVFPQPFLSGQQFLLRATDSLM